MANEEHLEILTQGVEQWNKWRLYNAIRADLGGAYLSRADPSGANLILAQLFHADLSRAALLRAMLFDANLNGATCCICLLRAAVLLSSICS